MANKHPNSEITPANTDDALEGPQRIREIKQAYNERLGRDHLIGGITSPDVIAQGADSDDSGYHRRITIKEETSAQGGPADTRLNATSTGINHSTTAKMAEVWMEKHSGTADETSMLFLGTEGTGNQRTVVTTTQTQTLTNKTLTAATLTNPTLSGGSGAIDGVAVGTTTEAAGKFTTLESTGNTIIGNSDTADTLTVKATTSGLSSDASGFAGANKMYAGIAGEIKLYAGTSLPAGWLWCDGAQYEKTAKAELFAAIGTTYNAPGDSVASGDYANFISSSSWFRIPDLRGRTPLGAGTGNDSHTVGGAAGLHPSDNLTARTLGDYGAHEDFTLVAADMPRHNHLVTFSQGDGSKHNHITGGSTSDEAYKHLLRKRNDGHNTAGGYQDTTIGEPDLITGGVIEEVTHTVSHTGGDTSATLALTCGTTDTSTTVTAVSTTGMVVGQTVSGAGIPSNSTVVSIIANTSFVLSSAATATATVSLTFTGGDGVAKTHMTPWIAINYIIKY